MFTTTIERSARSRARRIERSSIVLIALIVVFALLVLLQMLPGSHGEHTTDSVRASAMLTLPYFIAGAVASMVTIAAFLLRATRREV